MQAWDEHGEKHPVIECDVVLTLRCATKLATSLRFTPTILANIN